MTAALTVALSALAGCGGGGDGGTAAPASSTPAVPAGAITITSGNAGGLTAEAVDAGTAGAAGGSATLLTGVEVQATTSAQPSAWRRLPALLRLAAAQGGASVVVGVTVDRLVECTVGSISVTGNQALVNSASPGDTLNITFNDCFEFDIGQVSGSMALTIVQANANPTLFVADGTLTNLTLSRGTRVDRLSGPLRLSFDDRAGSQTVIDATSSGLTYTRLVNDNLRSQRTLTDYTYRAVITASNGQTAETFSYAATGNFERLGQGVAWSASTTQPLVTPAGAARPASGAGRILGAAGRSVAVTVTPTGLRLDIDHSGDSGTDTTSDLTWAQFDALL
ncbi:hypothetical protein [Aquabacterium sp. J223]|uniref:hypothetical protein n=1 Tax=Aquabacterium sp. J223 TaxID=2898431 RepID=UPI0021AE16EA|nr:hypothetical protein [Aquabacterium sp. J223]UUX96744.1 hypothetical protein LRS07_05525 [Aquabacterium sp. J223]